MAYDTHGSDEDSVETVAMQIAALAYQHQMTANTAANSSQRNKQQFAQLAMQQNMVHDNLHQIIAQVNALMFNASNQRRGLDGSAVKADTAAVPMSADDPANTEEGIPLLHHPLDNTVTARP
jgi:hypothetical protein